jgi:hypothetical protein
MPRHCRPGPAANWPSTTPLGGAGCCELAPQHPHAPLHRACWGCSRPPAILGLSSLVANRYICAGLCGWNALWARALPPCAARIAAGSITYGVARSLDEWSCWHSIWADIGGLSERASQSMTRQETATAAATEPPPAEGRRRKGTGHGAAGAERKAQPGTVKKVDGQPQRYSRASALIPTLSCCLAERRLGGLFPHSWKAGRQAK